MTSEGRSRKSIFHWKIKNSQKCLKHIWINPFFNTDLESEMCGTRNFGATRDPSRGSRKPISPSPFILQQASTRPRKPEKFRIHRLFFFEWFTLHNWLSHHKIIWKKFKIWLFEQLTANGTSMMSLTVNELLLVLLCDWDVTIPAEPNAILWLDSAKRFIKW